MARRRCTASHNGGALGPNRPVVKNTSPQVLEMLSASGNDLSHLQVAQATSGLPPISPDLKRLAAPGCVEYPSGSSRPAQSLVDGAVRQTLEQGAPPSHQRGSDPPSIRRLPQRAHPKLAL